MEQTQKKKYREDRPIWLYQNLWYSTGTPEKDRAEKTAVEDVLHVLSCPLAEPEVPYTVTSDPDDPWVLLASAIIYRAAMDYLSTIMTLMARDSKEIHRRRDECLAFFHSAFFRMLTRLDPDELVRALNERAQKFIFGEVIYDLPER